MNEKDPKREFWKAHQREQRLAWLKLNYAERIRWLDQAKQFAVIAVDAAKKRNTKNRNLEG
jgi:hypothetical protein